MDEKIQQVIAEILKYHKTYSLGTVGEEGPWVAGTYFAEDEMEFYSLVTHGTQTLKNIRHNRNVAFCVDSREPVTFLQGAGIAEETEGDEFKKGEQLLLKKIPEIEPFMQSPSYSIVRIKPKKLCVTDFTKNWFPAKVIKF